MRRAVFISAVAGMVVSVMAMMGPAPGHRPAEAQQTATLTGPTLQFGCGVAQVAAMDPIFRPEHPHWHVFYGNGGVAADSTHESLVSNSDTTCNLSFATSSYWHPVIKNGTEVVKPRRLAVYYVGRGDQSRVQPVPDGLQLLASRDSGKVDYRCGQGRTAPITKEPPYGCTADVFRIRIQFPECWDRSSLAPDSLVRMTGDSCPSSHPYQIPSIQLHVHYENQGGVLEGPLTVSAGNGEFFEAEFFHADVFEAPQQPGFADIIRRCVTEVGDGEVPPSVCRPGLRPETTLGPTSFSGIMGSDPVTFSFSSTEPDTSFQCRVYRTGTRPGSFGHCSGNGTHRVSGLGSGTYTFEVRAIEPGTGQEDLTPARRSWRVDTTAPAVSATVPVAGQTEVKRNTNLKAMFSERMDPDRIDGSTFKLFRLDADGSAVQKTDVVVSLSSDGLSATLNPFGRSSTALAANTRYRAVVTTDARDRAGNALDQNPKWRGSQQKAWNFKTGRG